MQKKKMHPGIMFVHFMFLILCVVCIYPLLLILFNAITSEAYILENGYVYWPKEVTFAAFAALLSSPQKILNATAISLLEGVGGPIIGCIVQSLAGYALMREDFILKKPLKYYYMLALFLPSAGMIPTYIINTEWYHLENNLLAYVLPTAVSAMGIFLYRTFFNSIPKEISESARIDGCSPMQIWAKMMVPLSKSFIATQFFLGLSARWKDYQVAMLYMTEQRLQNLEYYIQQVIKDIEVVRQMAVQTGGDVSAYPAETVTFAIVFFSLVPVMIVFPLMQKYFEKGAVVGAVKG